MASYVTGNESGDSDGDDNLQWLKHGPHDKNQTLAPMWCQGHFRVGEEGRKETEQLYRRRKEDNGDGGREHGIEIQSRGVMRRMRWW